MIKVSELKAGDIVTVNDEGVHREGTVVNTSLEEHQALVDNGIQEFWYDQEQMDAIPIDADRLKELGFTAEENGRFTKYMKGAFRLVVENNDFSNVEMWYREDRRHFSSPVSMHQLQNLYHQMTKVYLERP